MIKDRLLTIKTRLSQSALFKDSFWALMGSFMGRGLALLASIIIARLLGKDLFGVYGFVRTILLSIGVFSTFGLGYSATKFIAEYMRSNPEWIKSVISDFNKVTLTTSCFFAVNMFLFSEEIAKQIGAPDQHTAIRYLSIIVIFNSITTTQTGILAGFKKFKQLTRIQTINGIITFLSGVILTYFYSLNGALIALLISQMFNCVQNYIEVRKSINLLGVNHQKVTFIRKLTTFSLPITLHEMVSSLTQWAYPILIVKFSNIGELGLYSAASQWSAVILFIPGTLQNVIFSHLSSTNDNLKTQTQILKRMTAVNFVATFIPFLIILLFSKFITGLYGESFYGMETIMNILIFTTIFTCMTSVMKNYFVSTDRAWFTLIIFISSNLLIILLFVISQYFTTYPTLLSLVIINVFVVIITYSVYLIYFKNTTHPSNNK